MLTNVKKSLAKSVFRKDFQNIDVGGIELVGFPSKTKEKTKKKLEQVEPDIERPVYKLLTIDILPKFSYGRLISLCLPELQKRTQQ